MTNLSSICLWAVVVLVAMENLVAKGNMLPSNHVKPIVFANCSRLMLTLLVKINMNKKIKFVFSNCLWACFVLVAMGNM